MIGISELIALILIFNRSRWAHNKRMKGKLNEEVIIRHLKKLKNKQNMNKALKILVYELVSRIIKSSMEVLRRTSRATGIHCRQRQRKGAARRMKIRLLTFSVIGLRLVRSRCFRRGRLQRSRRELPRSKSSNRRQCWQRRDHIGGWFPPEIRPNHKSIK